MGIVYPLNTRNSPCGIINYFFFYYNITAYIPRGERKMFKNAHGFTLIPTSRCGASLRSRYCTKTNLAQLRWSEIGLFSFRDSALEQTTVSVAEQSPATSKKSGFTPLDTTNFCYFENIVKMPKLLCLNALILMLSHGVNPC